mmetsp:Transcript_16932/g.46356  ORF Transcript_16932/g.46356 Transcript_16932/m.46356 type:complete len:101 (-) Transcript_16932:90-392(-)
MICLKKTWERARRKIFTATSWILNTESEKASCLGLRAATASSLVVPFLQNYHENLFVKRSAICRCSLPRGHGGNRTNASNFHSVKSTRRTRDRFDQRLKK